MREQDSNLHFSGSMPDRLPLAMIAQNGARFGVQNRLRTCALRASTGCSTKLSYLNELAPDAGIEPAVC